MCGLADTEMARNCDRYPLNRVFKTPRSAKLFFKYDRDALILHPKDVAQEGIASVTAKLQSCKVAKLLYSYIRGIVCIYDIYEV
jgi:hypothetical protein